jgi:acetyl/propionyl-CoA carboxylase alpha subunit
MRRALLELTIDGVETSRDFHLRVMDDPEFQRGAIDTRWLERRLDSLMADRPPADGPRAAAIAAALLAEHDRQTRRASPAVRRSVVLEAGRGDTALSHRDADIEPDSTGSTGNEWIHQARLDALR